MNENKIISLQDFQGTNIEKAFNTAAKTFSPEIIQKAAMNTLTTNLEKGLITQETFDKAVKQLDELMKGGEGSRGGKVIGHTKSGKPIYAGDKVKHEGKSYIAYSGDKDSKTVYLSDGKKLATDHKGDALQVHESRLEHDENKPSKKDVTELSSGDLVVLKKDYERAIISHKIDSTKYAVRTKSGQERTVNLNAIDSVLADKKEIKKSEDLTPLEQAFDTFGLLEKGGEGSRGGKVIGHTKSGKPVYMVDAHKYAKNFSADDHKDAADLHNKLSHHHDQQKHAAYRDGDEEDTNHHHAMSHHHSTMSIEHAKQSFKTKQDSLHPDEKRVADEHKKKQAEHHKKPRDFHEDMKTYLIKNHGGAGADRDEHVNDEIRRHRERADHHHNEYLKHGGE